MEQWASTKLPQRTGWLLFALFPGGIWNYSVHWWLINPVNPTRVSVKQRGFVRSRLGVAPRHSLPYLELRYLMLLFPPPTALTWRLDKPAEQAEFLAYFRRTEAKARRARVACDGRSAKISLAFVYVSTRVWRQDNPCKFIFVQIKQRRLVLKQRQKIPRKWPIEQSKVIIEHVSTENVICPVK